MKSPRLGDIVIFRSPSAEFRQMNNGSQDAPAVITAVHTPHMVNLRVFTDGSGAPLWKTSVGRDESGKSDYASFRNADTVLQD